MSYEISLAVGEIPSLRVVPSMVLVAVSVAVSVALGCGFFRESHGLNTNGEGGMGDVICVIRGQFPQWAPWGPR